MTATDPLALEGRDERPLTAVTPIDLEPSAVPARRGRRATSARRRSGVIVAGRQLDPELREPLAHLAARRRLPDPRRADLAAALRPPRPLARRHHLRPAAARRALPRARAPDLVLRFGEMPTSKPLRAWLAASRRRPDRRRPARRLERADPPRRGDPARRPDRAGRAAGRRGSARGPRGRRRSGSRPSAAAREAIDGGAGGARTSRPSPACTLALGGAHRDGDLVYTASSMPIRDQEAFLPSTAADALFLCNRGANGIDGLVSSGIGAAHASGRPTTIVTGDLGLLHDIGGLAALRDVSTPVRIVVIDNDGGGIFHFLPQAEALERGRVRGPARHPARRRRREGRRRSSTSPTAALESLADLADALAAGTGLIEVAGRPRANVDSHRRLAAASPRLRAACPSTVDPARLAPSARLPGGPDDLARWTASAWTDAAPWCTVHADGVYAQHQRLLSGRLVGFRRFLAHPTSSRLPLFFAMSASSWSS